jgi:hypothetical protein
MMLCKLLFENEFDDNRIVKKSRFISFFFYILRMTVIICVSSHNKIIDILIYFSDGSFENLMDGLVNEYEDL